MEREDAETRASFAAFASVYAPALGHAERCGEPLAVAGCAPAKVLPAAAPQLDAANTGAFRMIAALLTAFRRRRRQKPPSPLRTRPERSYCVVEDAAGEQWIRRLMMKRFQRAMALSAATETALLLIGTVALLSGLVVPTAHGAINRLPLGHCRVPARYKAIYSRDDVVVFQRPTRTRLFLRGCSRSTGRDALVFTVPGHAGLFDGMPNFRVLGSWLVISGYEGSALICHATGIIMSVNVRTGQRGPYVQSRSCVLSPTAGPVPTLGFGIATPFAMTRNGCFAWVDTGIPPGGQTLRDILYAPGLGRNAQELDSAPEGQITDLRTSGAASVTYRNAGKPITLRLPAKAPSDALVHVSS